MGCRFTVHGAVHWVGFLLPSKAEEVEDAPGDLELEGVDHADRLRVPCRALEFRDKTVCEIARSLIASLPGISTSDVTWPSSLLDAEPDVPIEYYARAPGEDTVLDLVDDLLHQYGHVLYAKPDGKFSARSWIWETLPAPVRTYTDEEMFSGLRVEHQEIQHESVAVEWSVVAEQENALLYRENLPRTSDGERLGKIVLQDTYFPVRGAVDAIWQQYRSDWLTGGRARGGMGVDLLYATDQVVQVDADEDIDTITAVHEALRSRVVLHNTGTDDTRRLRIFDIRGTAVYRAERRKSVVTTMPAVRATVGSRTSDTVFTLVEDDGVVSEDDGAYTTWTVIVAGVDAFIESYAGSTRKIILAEEPDGWAVEVGDEVVLRPPANGLTLDVDADAIFDADSARRLAVARKNGLLEAWSYRFGLGFAESAIAGEEEVHPGDCVSLNYDELDIDRECVVRQRTDIFGRVSNEGEPEVLVELVPSEEVDISDSFPGPTLADASIEVDSTPGASQEELFAITDDEDVPDSKLPSNDWGYLDGGTSDGLAWSATQPSVTATNPIGVKVRRVTSGAPMEGADVEAEWGAPSVVSRVRGRWYGWRRRRAGCQGVCLDSPRGVQREYLELCSHVD